MLKSAEFSDKNELNEVVKATEKEATHDVIFDNLVWLSSVEAAQYLRKSANALRTAVSRGQLPAHKWRRRLFFRKKDLDDLILRSFRKEGL